MFRTDDPVVNLQLMTRMVFPEAKQIVLTSGPKIEVLWRPRGRAAHVFAVFEISDLRAAFDNAGIHPLTYFSVTKQRAEARMGNFD